MNNFGGSCSRVSFPGQDCPTPIGGVLLFRVNCRCRPLGKSFQHRLKAVWSQLPPWMSMAEGVIPPDGQQCVVQGAERDGWGISPIWVACRRGSLARQCGDGGCALERRQGLPLRTLLCLALVDPLSPSALMKQRPHLSPHPLAGRLSCLLCLLWSSQDLRKASLLLHRVPLMLTLCFSPRADIVAEAALTRHIPSRAQPSHQRDIGGSRVARA